jgi:hypothetical protein
MMECSALPCVLPREALPVPLPRPLHRGHAPARARRVPRAVLSATPSGVPSDRTLGWRSRGARTGRHRGFTIYEPRRDGGRGAEVPEKLDTGEVQGRTIRAPMAFQCKEIEVPLFGVIEDKKSPEALLSRFANASAPRFTISLDDKLYDLIADQLELEGKGVVDDLQGYVDGNFRTKSKGPGGNRLGDFGEVVTFIYFKQKYGIDLTRVVGWRPAPNQKIKGGKFPQPDFLLTRDRKLGCLEVKSTEALTFRDLQGVTTWRKLAPCRTASALRSEALPQLAYSANGRRTDPIHSLMTNGSKPVPFPCAFGIAIGVLVQDGRLRALESQKGLRTPRACGDKKRNCWTCLKASAVPADVIFLNMHNEPGQLALLGDQGESWLPAYQRWEESIWARDLAATRATTEELHGVTSEWAEKALRDSGAIQLRGRNRRLLNTLSVFWDRYIAGCVIQHGLGNAIANSDWANSLHEQERHEPPVRHLSQDDLDVSDVMGQTLGRYSMENFEEHERGKQTFSVGSSAAAWDLRMCSDAWWNKRVVEGEEATRIARDLVNVALGRSGSRNEIRSIPLDLESIQVEERGRTVQIGWRNRPWWDGRSSERVQEVLRTTRGSMPQWMLQLLSGGPTARLHVFRDGRAHLRILRSH